MFLKVSEHISVFLIARLTASVVYWFACWPLVPEFVGSNPAEAVGFFLFTKSSACLPSERKLNNLPHVPTLRHVKGT
jgi:hypothetical protein